MISRRQLELLSQIGIDKINRKDLADVSAIHIEEELPQQEKLQLYLEQVNNPYCFLCGKTPVKICFTGDGPDLGALLAKFFIHLKQS